MKPGDLVQINLVRRQRGGPAPRPIGILVDIRRREYPLQGERDLEYIVLVDGKERSMSRRWLSPVLAEIDNHMENPW